MRRIARWLHARGYRLVRGLEFSVDPTARVVTYPARASRRLRVVLLLHECGHILCAERYNYDGDPVDRLHEELDAWRRGSALGRRLGVRASQQLFKREREWRIRGHAWELQRPSTHKRYERALRRERIARRARRTVQ